MGSRTSVNPEGGSALEYDFDQAGRLKAAASETYAYGGDGLRLSASGGGRVFSWDRSGGIPEMLTDGSHAYLYGPAGIPIARVAKGGEVNYLHVDQLGSVRAMTNSAGEMAGAASYTPFGTVAAESGVGVGRLGFAGQYSDSATGFQYLRSRYYDPKTAQFITRDPDERLTRSPYGYAAQNPLSHVDPTGRSYFQVPERFPIISPIIEGEEEISDASRSAGEYFFDKATQDPMEKMMENQELLEKLGYAVSCVVDAIREQEELMGMPSLGERLEGYAACAAGALYAAEVNPYVAAVPGVGESYLAFGCLSGIALSQEGIPSESLPPVVR